MRGDAWWEAIPPRLTPLSGREPGDEVEPLSADALEIRLRTLLAPYIDGDAASRVALSREFRRHLGRVEATGWYGGDFRPDFTLLSASGIVDRFAHALRIYGRTERDDDEWGSRVSTAGAWVAFTYRGDHDVSFVCCDPTREEFGMVGHTEDDHPWLNGVGRLQSFRQWRRSIQRRPLPAHLSGSALDEEPADG